MKHAHELAGVPAQLWRMVALARHRLLMLDYDGTLAPFHAVRGEAVPLPRSLDPLKVIAAGSRTTVAIISGRPIEEVERLVGPLPAIFVGEHGWERRDPDGSIVRHPLDPSVAAALDEAEEVARGMGWGGFLERKRSGVVLHARTLPDDQARDLQDRCAEVWQHLLTARHMRVDRIDHGVELRARLRDKGTVALSLLSESPPGSLGVFVGDDVTDEDAFDVVRDSGFGVRVGDRDLPSLALAYLPSCEAVGSFLEEWLRVTEAVPDRGGDSST